MCFETSPINLFYTNKFRNFRIKPNWIVCVWLATSNRAKNFLTGCPWMLGFIMNRKCSSCVVFAVAKYFVIWDVNYLPLHLFLVELLMIGNWFHNKIINYNVLNRLLEKIHIQTCKSNPFIRWLVMFLYKYFWECFIKLRTWRQLLDVPQITLLAVFKPKPTLIS